MKKYLNELKRLSSFLFGDPQRDDTKNLNGFPNAWKKAACEDPVFVQTQLDVGQSMYLKPALKYAASVGVKSNLGKAIFYGKCRFVVNSNEVWIADALCMIHVDTIVQHGWQVKSNTL